MAGIGSSMSTKIERHPRYHLVHTLIIVTAVAFLIAVYGCEGSGDGGTTGNSVFGGQTGSEPAKCEPVQTTSIGLDETTPLGFTVSEALAFTEGSHTATLSWIAGESSELTVEVTPSSDGALFEEREYRSDESGIEMAMLGCQDAVVIEASVTFITEDGAFDEQWEFKLEAIQAEQVTGFQQLDLDKLGGSYQVTEVDPAEYDEITAFVDFSFEPERFSGEISGQASRVGGEGDDSVASATNFEIATW